MTTQDEARIRLAIDPSQIEAGMQRAGSMILDHGNRILKRFNALLSTNIYLMALNLANQLVREVLPTAEEFWNRFYGVDEARSKSLENAASKFRSLVQTLATVTAQVQAKEDQRAFDALSLEGKQSYLAKLREIQDQRLEMAAEDEAEAQADVDRMKRIYDANKDYDPIMASAAQALLPGLMENLGNLAIAAKNTKLESLQLDERILAVNQKLTTEAERQAAASFAAYNQFQTAQDALAAGRRAPLEFSLQELAQTRARYTNNFSGQSFEGFTPGAMRAQNILRMQEQARFAALMGWSNAQGLGNRAQAAEAALKQDFPFLKDPLEKLVEAADRTADALDKGIAVEIKSMG